MARLHQPWRLQVWAAKSVSTDTTISSSTKGERKDSWVLKLGDMPYTNVGSTDFTTDSMPKATKFRAKYRAGRISTCPVSMAQNTAIP